MTRRLLPSRHEELPLDRLAAHPHLRTLYETWRGKCAGERLPARFEIFEVPKPVLPYLMLVDLERAPDRLRIRLAGT